MEQPKLRGLALTIIGGVLMAMIAPLIFFAGFMLGAKDLADTVGQLQTHAPGDQVQLTANQKQYLYAYQGPAASTGVSSGGSLDGTVSCTVATADGTSVPLDSGGSGEVSNGSGRYGEVATFTPPTTGSYTITCGDRRTMVLSADYVRNTLVGLGTTVAIALAIATVIGLIGLVLLIIGIVRLVRSSKERSQWRLAGQQAMWNQTHGASPGGHQ